MIQLSVIFCLKTVHIFRIYLRDMNLSAPQCVYTQKTTKIAVRLLTLITLIPLNISRTVIGQNLFHG